MACNLGIMLLASAKMMAAVFGWPELWCILATAGLVGVYTCSGGLEAVVFTDVIQGVVMIIGCLLILTVGLYRVGGVSKLMDRLDEVSQQQANSTDASENSPSSNTTTAETRHQTQLILPVDTPTPFPWPGIYFGLALILSPAYWIGNQAIVQRSLGARSEFEAKAAYVWGAVLKNLIPIIVAVPGLIAVALLPDLKDGDMAIPRLVGEVLPTGARGIFVAAFLAALMSSVDSYLNSAATIVSNDFYKRFISRCVTESSLLMVGRITTIALVLWAIAFALYLRTMDEGSGLYAIFQTLMAFFQGPAFAILLVGIFWRRATGNAAFAALFCGIATSVSLFAMNQPALCKAMGFQPLFKISEPFLYFSVWSFVVTIAVLIPASLLTTAPTAEKTALVFGMRKMES